MTIEITKKLFEIKKEIQSHEKVKPAGRNDFHSYNYLTPSQVLGIVNPLLDKHKLFVEFIITEIKTFPCKTSSSKTTTDKETGNSTKQETTADTYEYLASIEICITDIESDKFQETITYIPLDKFSAQGYGAILTYVERYYYMKLFGIATNDDDPDSKEQKTKKSRPKI